MAIFFEIRCIKILKNKNIFFTVGLYCQLSFYLFSNCYKKNSNRFDFRKQNRDIQNGGSQETDVVNFQDFTLNPDYLGAVMIWMTLVLPAGTFIYT